MACEHVWVQDFCPDQGLPTSGTYCAKCGADPSEPGFAEAEELARLRKAVRDSEGTLAKVYELTANWMPDDNENPALASALGMIQAVIAPAEAKGGDNGTSC